MQHSHTHSISLVSVIEGFHCLYVHVPSCGIDGNVSWEALCPCTLHQAPDVSDRIIHLDPPPPRVSPVDLPTHPVPCQPICRDSIGQFKSVLQFDWSSIMLQRFDWSVQISAAIRLVKLNLLCSAGAVALLHMFIIGQPKQF